MDASASSQSGLITALTSGITAEALWANIAPFGAALATLVVFSFGYRFFRRFISKAGKGHA